MPYIFVDTGAWYALLDTSDANHHAAVRFKDSLAHPLITSNYVVDEVITLVRNRLGYKAAVEIGQKLWGESIANLIRVMPRDGRKVWDIFGSLVIPVKLISMINQVNREYPLMLVILLLSGYYSLFQVY